MINFLKIFILSQWKNLIYKKYLKILLMFIFTLKEILNYCIEFLWIISVLLENFQIDNLDCKYILLYKIYIFIQNSYNIHCYAGRSRSQAIGYVLNQYFNLYLKHNKEDFKRNLLSNNEKFMGNPDVIKVMNEVLYQEK